MCCFTACVIERIICWNNIVFLTVCTFQIYLSELMSSFINIIKLFDFFCNFLGVLQRSPMHILYEGEIYQKQIKTHYIKHQKLSLKNHNNRGGLKCSGREYSSYTNIFLSLIFKKTKHTPPWVHKKTYY